MRTASIILLLIVAGLIAVVVLATSNGGAQPYPGNAEASVTFPEPTNYAVDTAGVLTADELAQLNTKLDGIDTGNGSKQVAVVVIPSTSPLAIEQYGIQLADKWKVGDADKDNGVILIVATQDRKIRIEVGTGAEADITDAQAGDIIRDVISPKLKAGEWFNGISAGVDAINAKLN